MEEVILTDNIRQLGQTGIYIDVKQMADSLKNWMENTPDHIKKQQLVDISTIGLLLSVGTLFVLGLSK